MMGDANEQEMPIVVVAPWSPCYDAVESVNESGREFLEDLMRKTWITKVSFSDMDSVASRPVLYHKRTADFTLWAEFKGVVVMTGEKSVNDEGKNFVSY